jgi:hypothetical protein
MLNLEAGEGRTASLMLAHAFCMGLATVFFETAASALFLTRFPATAIPIVYIVAAIVSVVVGLLYSKIERRVTFWPLMTGTLACLAITVLVLRIAISLTGAAIVVFALFVWYRVLSILTDVEYWAVATRIYDIRQAKRLFGLIGSGEVTARMAGAFAIPLLVREIGTNNLIVLSALALLTCLGLLLAVKRDDTPEPRVRSEARGPRPEVWKDPYVRSIIAVAALGILGKHFVDFSFLQQLQIHHHDANQLAAFFGIFSGVTQALNLVIRVTVSGRYLQRFGIGVGLQTLPAVHLLCTVVLIVVAFAYPAAAPVFWLVIANQGIYKTLKHPIDNPSIKVLYQPLRRDTRLAVQVVNEVIATPLAIGVAGGVMLLFTRVAGFDLRVFGVIMFVTFILWIAASRIAWRRYVIALRDALQRRHVDVDILDAMDEGSLGALREHTTSEHPEEAIYALTLLERIGDGDIGTMLLDATRHPSPIVRSYAATRTKDTERLREMIASDEEPVADAALIALRGTPEAATLLSSPLVEVREATRRALIESVDTASALARIRGSVFPRAIELAIGKLEDHHLHSAATSILVAAGEDSLAAIATQLERHTDVSATQRLLRICGRIGGERATTLVHGYLRSNDERIREQALMALVKAGYRASLDEHGAIESMIRSDAEEGANESSLRDGLPDRDPFVLVRSALASEADRARQRVMLALSLIGNASAIDRARRQLESSSRERRAYATELLDASIPPNLRRSVLPLFTGATTTSHLEPAAALRKIAAGRTFTPWTRACAEHALEPTMQPTIEKVITLKSVDLFARTPDDVLAQLAGELETIDVPAGETIIRKGEMGDSLYVIASGTVRVHDSDTTIAILGEREIFGELAVLDPEPRSASVTAQTAVKLYRLDRDDLFELLPDHIEMVRGIFHVLCGRLRRRT